MPPASPVLPCAPRSRGSRVRGWRRGLENGSAAIRSVSLDEVLQNLRVRRLPEPETAALAARRLGLARLGPLRNEAEALRDGREADFERFWTHDDALHALIAQGCGVPLLASLIADLRTKARMCNLRQGRPAPGRWVDPTPP